MNNPLIGETEQDTLHNVADALDALMLMLAHTDPKLYRLMTPVQSAIDHIVNKSGGGGGRPHSVDAVGAVL